MHVQNISNLYVTGQCFPCDDDFTETIELDQWSAYTDVSQIEHIMMRIKTTDNMRTVNTLLAN